jgi:TAP-like protein
LLNGSANTCMQNAVSSYIVDGVVPAQGVRCTATP